MRSTESIERKEIEERLAKMGDYVKINFLNSCLKKYINYDSRRFVLTQLARLYEERKMFFEGGRMMQMASSINVNESGKAKDLMKSAELFVAAGKLDDAENSADFIKSFAFPDSFTFMLEA